MVAENEGGKKTKKSRRMNLKVLSPITILFCFESNSCCDVYAHYIYKLHQTIYLWRTEYIVIFLSLPQKTNLWAVLGNVKYQMSTKAF